MSHNHASHNHNLSHTTGSKAVVIALILNLSFTIIEAISGYISNSTAILSDAVHDFGDSIAIAFALFLLKISERKESENYPFGHKRWSLISALSTALILLIGSAFMIFEASSKLSSGDFITRSNIVIPVAIIGLLFNGLAAKFLFHSHDDDHAQRSIALHFLEDILGWAAVLIGAIIIYFTQFHAIDPILSIAISIFIAYNAIKKLIQVLPLLVNSKPKNLSNTFTQVLNNSLGIRDSRKLKIWTLDGKSHAIHIYINKQEWDILEDQELRSHLEHDLLHEGFEIVQFVKE